MIEKKITVNTTTILKTEDDIWEEGDTRNLLVLRLEGKPQDVEVASPVIEKGLVTWGPVTKGGGELMERKWLAMPPDPEPKVLAFEEALERFQVPSGLRQDPWWRPILYIFTQVQYLNRYLTPEYFDFDHRKIEAEALKRIDQGSGLSFLIELGLHLYNDFHELSRGLTPMGNLDARNLEIAMTALRMRFE